MSTLLQKIWDNHRVTTLSGSNAEVRDIVYIDLHLIHEVTSPQAFDGLRQHNRKVRRADLTFATVDHNIPTLDQKNIRDAVAKAQIETLEKNCREFSIRFFGVGHPHQGIVHVIGPEMGLTHPGATIVCGDSHTSTHGAFGALAFGIGTSEVEHVLATQCLILKKPKSLQVKFMGELAQGVTPKDMIMKLIGQIGTAGATGYVIEYTGSAISKLSMEGRMTICNMSIEAGARAGMIAPDATTFAYFNHPEREFSPQGDALKAAIARWKNLKTDSEQDFDHTVSVDIQNLAPQVTWGTSPSMVADVSGKIPKADAVAGHNPEDIERALAYMGLTPGMSIGDIPVDVVFIGSCTNARIEDLRQVAAVLKGKKVSPNTRVMVVPGSRVVQKQAQAEGLDKIFSAAGCEWREPGCSMCLAMNPDQLKPKERAASTSNRNFEGRQGKDGRTHLVSPLTAAATALRGKITDPREILGEIPGVR